MSVIFCFPHVNINPCLRYFSGILPYISIIVPFLFLETTKNHTTSLWAYRLIGMSSCCLNIVKVPKLSKGYFPNII